MNAQDRLVFKEIARELADSPPRWSGTEMQLDPYQNPSLQVHAHSFIARYTAQHELRPIHVLVKLPHRPNQGDLQAALHDQALRIAAHDEYNQMLDTWKAFGQTLYPDCKAVQPLGFLEPWNAIVMLEIDARPLRSLLSTPRTWFGRPAPDTQFSSYLRTASRWLKSYHHHVGASRAAPVSRELMTERLDKIAGDVAAHLGDRSRAPEYLYMLRDRIDKFSGLERIARLHGDFHASNILFTPRGAVCVLDPRADVRLRSVYQDLATLLVDLQLKPFPMLTGGRFVKRFLEQSRNSVVDSYFEPGEYQPDLLDFYCACEAIFRWSMITRDLMRRKRSRLVAPVALSLLTGYLHSVIRRHAQPQLTIS